MSVECQSCQGKGYVVKGEQTCPTCNGAGKIKNVNLMGVSEKDLKSVLTAIARNARAPGSCRTREKCVTCGGQRKAE